MRDLLIFLSLIVFITHLWTLHYFDGTDAFPGFAPIFKAITKKEEFNGGKHMRRCRIALISDHSDPALEEIGTEGAGGQNVYVRQLGEHLSRLGWDVDMFTRQWKDQPSIVIHNPNCRTIRLRAGPIKVIPRDDMLSQMDEFLESFLLFQGENDMNYDVFHTNYWLSGVVGLKLKEIYPSTPLVYVAHSLGQVKDNWLQIQKPMSTFTNVSGIKMCRYVAESNILRDADLVIATSPQEKVDMRQFYGTCKSSRQNVFVIPAGVNTAQFSSDGTSKLEARERINVSPNSKLVLYVGRFDKRKGIDVLVEAVSRSKFRGDPNLMLVIVGGKTVGMVDEAEFDRIQRLVQVHNLQTITTFTGLLSRGYHNESLQQWYAAADLLVVPSHYEPFGLVTIEAMAMGTAVVASGIGGLQSTVSDGETGFLVPPGDYHQFSKRIDKILENPKLAKRMGNLGIKRVHKYFTWEKVAEKTDKRLRELLGSKTSLKSVNIKLQ